MVCCTGYCSAEAQFNHKVAKRDLRRYRRRGADATTRLLLAELRRRPLEGRHLLDVGGGIGVISGELSDAHVASAVTVKASPAYLEVAQREVGPKYGSRPTQFVLGDFAVIAGTLPDADVVTLDRVVCCYPDPEALLGAAAAKTRQVLAFTYPRVEGQASIEGRSLGPEAIGQSELKPSSNFLDVLESLLHLLSELGLRPKRAQRELQQGRRSQFQSTSTASYFYLHTIRCRGFGFESDSPDERNYSDLSSI